MLLESCYKRGREGERVVTSEGVGVNTCREQTAITSE